MARRRYLPRPGLLGILLSGCLLCMFPSRGALPDELVPGLEIQTSPRTPVLRSVWTLAILVDHPIPSEVSVRPPPFPEALSLEQVRTGIRMSRDPGGGERRLTVVEFLFLPRTAGTVTLAPFEVVTPRGRALTGEISLRIPPAAPPSRSRFSWVSPSPFLVIGEGAEVALRFAGEGGFSNPLPPEYRPEAPENVIMDTLPLEAGDREEGIVLRLRIVPLSGRELSLPPFRVSSGGAGLEIPGLKLPLRPPVVSAAGAGLPPEAQPEPPPEIPASPEPPPFPDLQSTAFTQTYGFPLFRGEYERVREQVKGLWEGGRRAEALAEIRRNERESSAGPGLRPLRRAMESALGIEDGVDEPWRPQKLPLVVLPGILILIALLMGGRLLGFRLSRGEGNSRAYNGILTFLLASLFLAALLFTVGAAGGLRPREGAAVVREAPVYRIPDTAGAVEARFDEGRRVVIRAASGLWMYVESPEGTSGWVRREQLIPY